MSSPSKIGIVLAALGSVLLLRGGYPEMGFLSKFVLTAVFPFPQLTFWTAFTMVLGTLFGGLTAAVVSRTRASEARAA